MRETAGMQFSLNETDVVQIAAIRGRTILRLKSWLPEYRDGSNPVVLAGRELPSEVNTSSSGPLRALCVGPGEWLIVSEEGTASHIREQFAIEPLKHGSALIDISHGIGVLEIQGSLARDLLSKGCGLDLHARCFSAGQCTRTRFAQVPLVIEYLSDPARFNLYVTRSHSTYLHSWLTDAAIEFRHSPH